MKLPTLGKGGWGLFPMQVLLYMFLIPLVESWDPWRGWRIGEASRPGPENQNCLEILSANVTSLNKHKKNIIGWEADVKALQETRLGKQAQEIIESQFNQVNLNSIFGAPQAPKVLFNNSDAKTRMGIRNRPRESIWNSKEGGVAIIANRLHKIENDTPGDFKFEVHDLWSSGRWTCAILPIGGGSRSLTVHSFYGEAKANCDPIKQAERERQLATIFTIAAGSGDSPIVICTDLNCEANDSQNVAKQLDRNEWIDAGNPFPDTQAKPTFLKDGPFKGMTRSDGATRPDTILLNKTAWKAFDGFNLTSSLESQGTWA